MSKPDSDDWQAPPAMIIPRATAWPLATAFGVTLILLGLVTVWLVSIAGAIVFGLAIVYWMGEMLREGRDQHPHG
jgi:hypothetical protein